MFIYIDDHTNTNNNHHKYDIILCASPLVHDRREELPIAELHRAQAYKMYVCIYIYIYICVMH